MEQIKGCPICGHIPMIMCDVTGIEPEFKDMFKINMGTPYAWNHDPTGKCFLSIGTLGPWWKTREDAIKFWNVRA